MSTRSDETVRIRRDVLAELHGMLLHLGRCQSLCYCATPQFECGPCFALGEAAKVLNLAAE